jgi:hypothetical protein
MNIDDLPYDDPPDCDGLLRAVEEFCAAFDRWETRQPGPDGQEVPRRLADEVDRLRTAAGLGLRESRKGGRSR